MLVQGNVLFILSIPSSCPPTLDDSILQTKQNIGKQKFLQARHLIWLTVLRLIHCIEQCSIQNPKETKLIQL